MSSPQPSASDRAFVVRSARVGIVVGVAAAAIFFVLWVLKAALTPLAAAFVIAYLLDPVVDRFEALRWRRGAAVALLVGLLGGGLAILLLVVVPRLQREIAALIENFPVYLDNFTGTVLPRVESALGIELPGTMTEVFEELRAGGVPLPLEPLRDLLAGTLTTLTGTVSAVVGFLVVPILAYYMLVEFDHLKQRVLHWVPPRHRPRVVEKAHTVDRLVSGFLRGQLLVAGTLGVLYAVGFTVIGIDLAVGVGLLAGALALIPYLGNVVAVLTAGLLCVLEFGLDWHLAAVLGWYVTVQALEGFVLTPRIVGGSVGLHPAVVIVALLIGGDLFGFLGLLIAVPAAAVVKVFVDEALQVYRRSDLFENEPATDAAGADGGDPG